MPFVLCVMTLPPCVPASSPMLVDTSDASSSAVGSPSHLTFLLPLARSEAWSEFFVREPALRPKGMLIQVLRADKDGLLEAGWRSDWEPFAATHPAVEKAARIAGVHLACGDARAAARVFTGLLGGEAAGDGVLRFRDSSMRVWLREGEGTDTEDSHVEVLGGTLGKELPPRAGRLVRIGAT